MQVSTVGSNNLPKGGASLKKTRKFKYFLTFLNLKLCCIKWNFISTLSVLKTQSRSTQTSTEIQFTSLNLITVLITESQRLKERLYKTKVGRAYQQRVNFLKQNKQVMKKVDDELGNIIVIAVIIISLSCLFIFAGMACGC